MKKLAIILDSFVGQDKKTIEKKDDFYFIPLKVILDGKEYLEGVDLEAIKLLNLSYIAEDAKTSQASPGYVLDLFEKLSKEYEHVIYLPTSGSLSGMSRTAQVLARDFENITVIDNIFVGGTFLVQGEIAKAMSEEGKSIEEIIKYLKENAFKFPTYVIPKTNDALIRGGRMGRAAAVVLKRLKTVPIIGFEDDEKLHKKMIKRSGEKAVTWAIDKLLKDNEIDVNELEWLICHTTDTENVDIAKKYLKELGHTRIHTQLTCGMIAVHTGDGSISMGLRYRTDKK